MEELKEGEWCAFYGHLGLHVHEGGVDEKDSVQRIKGVPDGLEHRVTEQSSE